MQQRNEFKCEAADPAAGAAQAADPKARLDAAVAAERARLAASGRAPGAALIDLLHRQGAARIDAGQPREAVACWAEAAALCEADTPPAQRAALLIDLGRLHLSLDEPGAAARPLDAAIALLRAAPAAGARDLALALATRAAVHGPRAPEQAVGLLTEAADLLEARVRRTQQAGDAIPLAHALLDLGRAQAGSGALPAARDSFARCAEVTAALLQAAPSLVARNMHNAALNHLGRAEAALGRPEVALGLFRESAADMRRLVHEEGRDDLADDLARAEADVAALEAELRPN
jgi:SWI/SNF-related matrix-associated actin-dependent regulator 1 of chromatin subfamily A